MGRALGCLAAVLPFASLACTTPIGDRASADRPIPPDTQIPNDEPFGLDAGSDASLPFPTADGGLLPEGGPRDAGPLPDGSLPPFGAFLDPPVRFAVPPNGLPDGFYATVATGGARGWATLDLDGDGAADLVQTSDPAAVAPTVFADAAGAYWRFFKGSRTGFASAPVRFAVPSSGLADGFYASEGPGVDRAWTLVDLNGDARPDLVQTADPSVPEGRVFRDAAGSFWRVFLNTGDGFASAPRRLPIPDSGLADGFASSYASSDLRQWSFLDLDGDGHRDLAQTANPARAGGLVFSDAAGTFWKRTRMVSAGDAGTMQTFASYTERFVVPTAVLADGFFATAFGSAPVGSRFWSTMDITGDGILDLVVTADPRRPGGYVWSDAFGDYWSVFRGEAGGFARIESRVRVPPSGLGDGFYAIAEDGLRSGRGWFVADLDGDALLELVQSADPSSAAPAAFRDEAGDYWKVYRLRDGLPHSRALRLGVPASGSVGGFFTARIVDRQRVWALLDLDGDGKRDLVQTANAAASTASVWSDDAGAYWRVWFGE